MEEDGYCVICDHLSATARSDKSEIVIDSNSQEIFLKAKKQRM
jgi:hypothetical protein